MVIVHAGAMSLKGNPLRSISSWISGTPSKYFKGVGDFCKSNVFQNEVYDGTFSLLLDESSRVWQPSQKELLNMRMHLEQLKTQGNSDLDVEIQTNMYMDRICEHYYENWLNKCSQFTVQKQFVVLRNMVASSCEKSLADLRVGASNESGDIARKVVN